MTEDQKRVEPDTGGLEPSAGAWFAAVAVLVLVALAAIWVPPYIGGMDMPIHLMSADILAHPDRYVGQFEAHISATSQGFVWSMVPLVAVGVPVGVAAKLALTLMLGLYVVAFTAIGRARGAIRPVGTLLGVASFGSFYLAMGFANFALAVPIAFLAFAAAIDASEEPSPRKWFGVGALLIVTAVLHVIVAACAIVQVGATALLAPGSPKRITRVASAVVCALPAAAYGGWVAFQARTATGWDDVATSLGVHRLTAMEQAMRFFEGPWGGFSALGILVAAATVIATVSRGNRWRNFAVATAAFWAFAYVLLPWHAEGWAYAQPRVLVFAWGIPAALGVWGHRPTRRLALVSVLVGTSLLAWGIGALRAGDQVAEVVDGFDQGVGLPGTALTASAGIVPSERFARPLQHASAYAVTRGTWLTDRYHFNPTIHSARPEPLPDDLGPPIPQFAFNGLAACDSEASCDHALQELADVAAQRARTWSTIVVVGAPEALRGLLSERGLQPIDPDRDMLGAPGGTLQLNPATLRLEVWLPPEFEGALQLRVGYPATIGWLDGAARPAMPIDGPIRLQLTNLPAGPIVIEVASGAEVLARGEALLNSGEPTPITIDAR